MIKSKNIGTYYFPQVNEFKELQDQKVVVEKDLICFCFLSLEISMVIIYF